MESRATNQQMTDIEKMLTARKTEEQQEADRPVNEQRRRAAKWAEHRLRDLTLRSDCPETARQAALDIINLYADIHTAVLLTTGDIVQGNK